MLAKARCAAVGAMRSARVVVQTPAVRIPHTLQRREASIIVNRRYPKRRRSAARAFRRSRSRGPSTRDTIRRYRSRDPTRGSARLARPESLGSLTAHFAARARTLSCDQLCQRVVLEQKARDDPSRPHVLVLDRTTESDFAALHAAELGSRGRDRVRGRGGAAQGRRRKRQRRARAGSRRAASRFSALGAPILQPAERTVYAARITGATSMGPVTPKLQPPNNSGRRPSSITTGECLLRRTLRFG